MKKEDIQKLVDDLKQLRTRRNQANHELYALGERVMRPEGETSPDLNEVAGRLSEEHDVPDTKAWVRDHNTRDLTQVIDELEKLLGRL